MYKTAVLIQYYLLTLFRNKFKLLELVLWPIFELGMFGYLGSYLRENDLSGPNVSVIILGGIIYWHFFYRVANEMSQQLFEDIFSRNLQNIFASPLNPIQIFGGLILSSLIKLSLNMLAILLSTKFLFGINFFNIGAEGIYLLLIVILWGVEMGLIVISSLFIFGHKVIGLTWAMVLFVQPFTCVFYSCSVLPMPAQKIAMMVPASYAMEAYRLNLLSSPIPAYLYLRPLVLLIFYAAVVAWFLNRSYQFAQKSGMLTKL